MNRNIDLCYIDGDRMGIDKQIEWQKKCMKKPSNRCVINRWLDRNSVHAHMLPFEPMSDDSSEESASEEPE